MLQAQRLGKLEDVKYKNTVLKRVLRVEDSNGRQLSVEIQDVFPLMHHALREECWASNWNSGNVDATLQDAFKEDGVMKCTVRHLNLASAKDELFFLV